MMREKRDKIIVHKEHIQQDYEFFDLAAD